MMIMKMEPILCIDTMMIMKLGPILCIEHRDLAKTQGGANLLNTFDSVSHLVLKESFLIILRGYSW